MGLGQGWARTNDRRAPARTGPLPPVEKGAVALVLNRPGGSTASIAKYPPHVCDRVEPLDGELHV
jgi:hypothetical protein